MLRNAAAGNIRETEDIGKSPISTNDRGISFEMNHGARKGLHMAAQDILQDM